MTVARGQEARLSQRTPGSRFSHLARRLLLHSGLLALFVVFIFPFLWMVISSVKPLEEMYAVPFQYWPVNPTFRNYPELLGIIPSEIIDNFSANMTRAMANSLFLASIYTVGAVLLSSLGGYAFAKLRFRGRTVLFVTMLATMMIPQSMGLIPTYMIMARIGWVDTWWPLIIPGLASPFGVFWMRQYIMTLPDEMLEAAQIDGAGPFAVYWRLVLPIAKPALAALAIFMFMSNWNAFLAPLIYLNSGELYTFPLFLSLLRGYEARPSPYTMIFAASLISIVPILIVFIFAQRHFVAGLTAGSVK